MKRLNETSACTCTVSLGVGLTARGCVAVRRRYYYSALGLGYVIAGRVGVWTIRSLGQKGHTSFSNILNVLANLAWAVDTGDISRRRDCHFADALSPSVLKHLLKVEGGAAK